METTKIKHGDKVKYLESDGWKFGTFDKASKSTVAYKFDVAFVDHVAANGNEFWKVCFLNELVKY